jgi:sorbitol-specific phosphotransferase system component IIBC
MKNMKKIFLFFFLVFVFLTLGQAQAEEQKQGLVPCGGPGESACTLCDFFQLFKNIVDFVLFKIIPVVAALMLVVGGIMFFLAGGSPETLGKAKKLLTSVIMGLIIVYGAWIFVNTFFMLIGVADWTGLTEGWWKIECQ